MKKIAQILAILLVLFIIIIQLSFYSMSFSNDINDYERLDPVKTVEYNNPIKIKPVDSKEIMEQFNEAIYPTTHA